MKKSLIVAALLFVLGTASAIAQPRAVGVRLGYGVEFSYQHGMGDNMLSIDAGLPGFGGIEAAVTYDWLNPFNTQIPWNEKGEWNWSLGVGGAAGWWWAGGSAAFVGVAGRVGVEYNFWFPLQLSVEWRPVFGPTFSKNACGFYGGGLYAGGIAIGVRYKF